MRVDAHLHLWPSPEGYSWLTPELAPLFRGFTADEAHAAITAAGFDRAVLVQAADTDADTEWLLELADTHPWILGVVGWVPLDDAAEAERLLDARAGRALVGIRALVNDYGVPDYLDRPAVRDTLGLIASRQLPFDVHDAWPHHLDRATRLAHEVEGLTVVLDHLGKVPQDARSFADWQSALRRFAAAPNTCAKLSGLHQGGIPLDDPTFARAWDLAFEAFGAERLMLGSDWPIPLLVDGFDAVTEQVNGAVSRLSPSDRAHIEVGTAERIYRWDT